MSVESQWASSFRGCLVSILSVRESFRDKVGDESACSAVHELTYSRSIVFAAQTKLLLQRT